MGGTERDETERDATGGTIRVGADTSTGGVLLATLLGVQRDDGSATDGGAEEEKEPETEPDADERGDRPAEGDT